MLSLLQLEDYWIDTLSVTRPQPSDSKEVVLNVGVEPVGKDDSSEFVRRLEIRFDSGGAEESRDIRVVIGGRFRIHPETPAQLVESFRGLNASSILYGVARGIVGQVTALTPGGKLNLPSFNFQASNAPSVTGKRTARSLSTSDDTPKAIKKKSPSRKSVGK